MTCDIFLRSYRADKAWIPFALRSMYRFVTGVRDIIVSVPAEDIQAFQTLALTKEKLVTSNVSTGAMDPYCGQQSDKLHADLYTDADAILFWDSDVIATRPFSPSDLLIDGKPRWLITPYAKLVNADGSPAVPWRPITQKAIGRDVEIEAMRAHPLMATSEALTAFRRFMDNKHGVSLGEYIARQPNREFSEWNAIGAWAFYYAPHFFSFWNTEEKGVPEPFVRQFWSWSGVTPEVRMEMEKILS